MLDRKLLVEALRVENKDVLPKFGSPELRKMMEAATEYISLDKILDLDDNTITENGIYTIMDMLDRGSVGIADENGQPALNFMKSGDEIYAHNMFTDEDAILDATSEALAEYIMDQMETGVYEEATADAENVIFLKEPNEYIEGVDILAVFPDEIDQRGDEGRVLVYSHEGQHSYASPEYIDGLEEATPEEYEDLKQELEGQGYTLNVLNGLQSECTERNEADLQNYAVIIARDVGNDYEEILEVKEGYSSRAEADEAALDLSIEYAEDDPEIMLFTAYSDGVSWFDANTGEELELADKDESISEASNDFTSLKEARREIARAKRKLQAKLDKGNFYENFGREEVRALRNRIPSYAEDMNQDELRAIQDEVAKFDEWCATAAPKQESRKNEVSDELKNKVAARRQIDAEIANDAENEILVKHGRKSKEYKKAHAKTNAAINKLNKFGRSSHDIIKSKEYQAMDDGKYAAPGIVRKNENSYDELLNMYKEEIDEAKARLDKCYKRVEYRLKENVSYSVGQATPIIANLATDVRTKSSEIVDEVYRKLG